MKSSIKFLAIIALVFTFSFAANAQRGGGRQQLDPEQMAERQTTRMVEQLTLNETQAAQVKEINLTYATKLKEAHEANEGGGREAVKEARAAIETEKNAELKLVLTEAQFQTYEEALAERGKGKKGKGRDGKSGRPGNN